MKTVSLTLPQLKNIQLAIWAFPTESFGQSTLREDIAEKMGLHAISLMELKLQDLERTDYAPSLFKVTQTELEELQKIIEQFRKAIFEDKIQIPNAGRVCIVLAKLNKQFKAAAESPDIEE